MQEEMKIIFISVSSLQVFEIQFLSMGARDKYFHVQPPTLDKQ